MNKLQEIFKAWNIAFDPNNEQAELAAKRIEICNSCDKKVTTLGINRCSVCGCALKGKVFSPVKGACPEGKWDEADGLKQHKQVMIEQIQDKSIFVQVASYRDPQLLPTIKDLFDNADRPEELTVCIAWQHSKEDSWDNLDLYIDDSRVLILDIPAEEAKGACWARNYIQQHYNNQAFTLQIDSHTRFIKGWDTELILMYEELKLKGSLKPLITSYLPSFNPDNDPEERKDEVWKMTFNRFTPEGYIFTYPALLDNWKKMDSPVPARFFSAHFAFTTGRHCIEVPHDPFMYFHGEEPSLASRSFTHGYDLFHPHRVIAWHFYTREGFKKHWDDHKNWNEIDKISHRRFRILHNMEQAYLSEVLGINEYGFGKERSLEDYERFAGVRYRDKKAHQHVIDLHLPPNPNMDNPEEYEKGMMSKFKHCLNIYKDHFKHDDYDFLVISFEKSDGTVIKRLDADEVEFSNLLKRPEGGDFVKIWREYLGEQPDKWVIWPHSKSKGYVERYEEYLNG